MGMWSDLLGTTESYLRLGKTGPRLKDSSGNLSIRNSGDSADVALTVLDEAYASSWNGSLQVPTKNAVYDKIESLTTGILSVNQSSHGFSVQQAVYYTGSEWALAKADASSTLSFGIVSSVTDTNNFIITFSGAVTGLSGLTAGQYYYVSATSAGTLTATEPNAGYYSNPLLFATSTTAGVVIPYRPSLVSSSSAAAFSNLDLNPGGRLTLASGDPYYNPNNTVAVSGQDTSADTITVTAHGWSVGTMVTSSATSGGITAATTYYVGNPTTNTVSLHTTLANAIAGTSKLDITGTVTANITAFGVANQTIYYTPAVHNQISLWDGSAWTVYSFTELSLALGTVTTSIGYDIFAYISGGAVAIEQLAWTSATARATGVSLQDGRYCKTGDKARLYLGSYYSRDTTSTEISTGFVISQVGGKCFLYNAYNEVDTALLVYDSTDNWTYATATIRQANAAAGNKVELFIGLSKHPIYATVNAVCSTGNTSGVANSGIGLDSTTAFSGHVGSHFNGAATTNTHVPSTAEFSARLTIGYHYIAWLECGGGSGTFVWIGSNSSAGNRTRCGMRVEVKH